MMMRALHLVGILLCFLMLSGWTEALTKMEKAAGEKRRLQDLRKQLLAKARPVPAEFRRLEDANNDQIANDDQVANDDTVVDDKSDDQVNYGYGKDSYLNADGLDLSSYSLKYVGCQAVNTWSDNMVADQDSNSVLALEQFVILRMCPSNWCSRYRKFGCGNNYGEYMILMEDYLAIMKQYHYSRFSTFCTTCKQCIQSNQNVAYQQANDDDAVNDDAVNDDAVNGDDQVNDDAANDDAVNGDDQVNDNAVNDDQVNDDAVNNDDAAGDDNVNQDDAVGDDYYVNQYGNDDYYRQNGGGTYDNGSNNFNDCQFQEECSGYEQVCATHQYNAEYENFIECTEIQVDNSVLYLGPHCGSDRHIITIGVFEDQYCSQFLGNVGSYDTVQDYDIDENSLSFYFPSTCISCSDQVVGWTFDGGKSEGTYELCEVMYETSAKCNKHLAISNDYESENQEETEQAVCSFIESLVENSYDESGEILFASDKYNWYNYHHYGMSFWQALWLAVSSALVVGLSAYVVYLKRAIVRRKAWTRPMLDKESPAYRAGRVSRNNSDIMISRSPRSWISEDETISSISGQY